MTVTMGGAGIFLKMTKICNVLEFKNYFIRDNLTWLYNASCKEFILQLSEDENGICSYNIDYYILKNPTELVNAVNADV